jgi:putative alpha-1,2-mannosidase
VKKTYRKFSKHQINLSTGKKFIIKAKNNSSTNKYIQTTKLNGKDLTIPFFTHEDLVSGGGLEFKMNNVPQ